MKEQTIRFICDCDGCESEKTIEGGNFPYEDGWIYLYKINFKTDPKHINEYQDKHFCCMKCMVEYCKKMIIVGVEASKIRMDKDG